MARPAGRRGGARRQRGDRNPHPQAGGRDGPGHAGCPRRQRGFLPRSAAARGPCWPATAWSPRPGPATCTSACSPAGPRPSRCPARSWRGAASSTRPSAAGSGRAGHGTAVGTVPRFRRIWQVCTVIWGTAILADAAIRVTMAFALPGRPGPGARRCALAGYLHRAAGVTNIFFARSGFWRILRTGVSF